MSCLLFVPLVPPVVGFPLEINSVGTELRYLSPPLLPIYREAGIVYSLVYKERSFSQFEIGKTHNNPCRHLRSECSEQYGFCNTPQHPSMHPKNPSTTAQSWLRSLLASHWSSVKRLLGVRCGITASRYMCLISWCPPSVDACGLVITGTPSDPSSLTAITLARVLCSSG